MTHVFALEDLSRHKLCLRFVAPGQPLSIHWQPLNQPLTNFSLTRSLPLSIRVDETVVDGHPSVAIFIVTDDAEEDHEENV